MFPWQVECLSNISVLNDRANLVYSAPTSAGKTLIAEILAIKTVLEYQKKVIFILPFVSIVREKMYYFQDILGTSGVRVEGFMGSYNPPGGFNSVQIAICTIEKANSLINRLLEEGNLSCIGAILVDEVHLLGDPSRGYLLELLLTKLRYISRKDKSINIQIIGMSATLPNLNHLSKWLDAELYTTNFRPIPLHEQAHVCGEIYDNKLKLVRKLSPLPELGTDTDNILQLCLETIRDSCSVLIFCPTKNWCENLSQQIATAFFKIGSSKSKWGDLLHSQLNTNLIIELLEQLKYCPVGLDAILRKTVSFGVAFHHAGLTMDERDIIESAFRNGVLRVLVATSTLSSGVNLPARRVIIRTPNFHGKPLDTLTYRQMIGRAGRMGKDSVGESLLICQKNDYKIAKELMSAHLKPVESCLEGAGKLKRAILEVIASGVASSPEDVALFTQCTLLAVEDEDSEDLSNPIEEAVSFLRKYEFIRLQKQEDGKEKYVATSLGKACLSSSMAPDEGLALFTELEKARQCFVLETELHLIYLVTPYSACNSWGNIDWMFYLELWERLPRTMKKVGELVGVQESYIVNATRGKTQTNTNKLFHKLMVHKRFFIALALQDLVNEKPLSEVCAKYNCNRGMLQSLQQSASSFAGMVTSFSRQLGWSSVEILISQFQDRLQFGVSRDLLDLMRLPVLNGKMARILYNAGMETVIQVANSDPATIENILHKVVPFQTEKGRDGESEFDKKQRNKFRNVWITGKEGLTEMEAAELLVSSARQYLKLEIGLAEAKWGKRVDENDSRCSEESEENSSDKDILLQELVPMNSGENSVPINEDKTPISQLLSKENSLLPSSLNSAELCIKNNNSETSLADIYNVSSDISEKSVTKIEDDENTEERKFGTKTTGTTSSCDSTKKTYGDAGTDKKEESWCTASFLDINLTKIEENLIESKQSTATALSNHNSFKVPQQSSSKNEVSHLLMSPPVELNISDSSVISSRSNHNVSNQCQSDQSLFNDSFNLQLSESDKESSKDSGVKELNNHNISNLSDTGDYLDNAFSVSFNTNPSNVSNISDDILTCSIEEETPVSLRKRKNGGVDQCFTTPSKKKKISKSKIGKPPPPKEKHESLSQEQLNSSYIRNKLTEDSAADFSKFDIINVCAHESLLELFAKELKQKERFSLSLACSKVAEKRPVIGMNIVNPEGIKNECPKENKFCCNYRKVDGFAVTWDGSNVFYLALSDDNYNKKIIKTFKTSLSNKNVCVGIFDSKEQIKLLHHCFGINFKGKMEDPKIADWVLEPEGKEKNLQAMTVKYCPEAVKLSQLAGGCKGVGSVALDLYSSIESKVRASVEAIVNWHLIISLKTIFKDTNCLNMYEVEMDTMLCLAKMEINGISVCKDLLQKLVESLKHQMGMIEKKAFSLAGRHFNFVSSADVAKVIGMFRGRKVSTRKQVLEQNEHPISDLVLQWRKINCTLTKMIYPLIRITADGRIRGCYINHTATGRITMHEPNLQNIAKDFEVINPVTKEKIKISCRSAFRVPENHCLISADYCQLELRILAHLSRDELLRNILIKPGDVFRSIAAKWNKVEEDEVNDTMRQNTKHICYGIIYGMGSKTLAEQLEIDESEAILFMDSFRNTYPGIKKFIKETIDSCRDKGYIETISGRRRYLPHINEANTTKRAQAERQAVNTTVQGSAADIAKKAMVKIEQELQEVFSKTKNKPKLVLHLHDELMYEVPTKYVKKVGKIIKKNMENCVQLSVPFPVKLKSGVSWGEMTEYIL
ncbi:DNA polymerase theta [Anoplophora glabripennis]|uniref:DNA polymerase theta n=1 Tax=Anoplophora glabripennis TaxID=217634 RepID=UPI000C75C424|nr:DNA polymerase theta [Anoplophora glabripennis]